MCWLFHSSDSQNQFKVHESMFIQTKCSWLALIFFSPTGTFEFPLILLPDQHAFPNTSLNNCHNSRTHWSALCVCVWTHAQINFGIFQGLNYTWKCTAEQRKLKFPNCHLLCWTWGPLHLHHRCHLMDNESLSPRNLQTGSRCLREPSSQASLDMNLLEAGCSPESPWSFIFSISVAARSSTAPPANGSQNRIIHIKLGQSVKTGMG